MAMGRVDGEALFRYHDTLAPAGPPISSPPGSASRDGSRAGTEGRLHSFRRSPFWEIPTGTARKTRPEGLQRFEIGSKIGKGFYREYPSGAFLPAASGSGQGGDFSKVF